MKLEEEIARIVSSHGAEFYDTETVSENGQTIYRVYITHEGGVSLDLCAEISREISPFLDIHPPCSGQYNLEVSSPGIERLLRKAAHFKSAVGELAELKVHGVGKIQGTVVSADDEGVVLQNGNNEEVRYCYTEIKKAKTVFDWSLQQ